LLVDKRASGIWRTKNGCYCGRFAEGLSKSVAPDTTAKALEEMKAKGIIIKADLEM
jgi:hypothetical protein